MKTSTIPTLLGPDGMTSLREYAGYHGGGSGFGGQLRAWNPPGESVDAALLPNFTRGNARADDLVRNNGYAANAIQLHQDHIVGSFFRLSHRPSWRYLGIGEEEARAFSREVEAAWKEFAEDDCCCIDVERKRTFTMMIREGVAMHAFNGELFVQATWDTSSSRLFRTQFRMVSPKRISNPNNTGDSRNCRAGVQINDSGAALVATPKALKKALEHEKTPELAAKLAAEAIERDPWAAQVSQLSLPKLVEQVALNAWKEESDNAVCLHLRSSQRHLNNRGAQQKLAEALSTLKGSTVELTIVEDDNPAVRTPLEWRQAIYEEKLAQARESIIADNNIQTLRRFFDAELDEESIRPI